MILKTDQLLKFSQFCKENELFFSSDRLSDLIIFLKKNELDNQDTEINFLYHLLPTNKLEKERLRDLINEFFGYSISTGQEEFLHLDEYKIDSMTEGKINIDFKNVSDDLLNNFGDIDFSRPVSNVYWLNQIKKSQNYIDEIAFFDVEFNSALDSIVNNQNKETYVEMLDLALLERIQELRNQFKEPYVPSDLSKKEDLQEKDFLFTDSDERNKLLKETRQLGLILANKFIRYSNSSSKGKLNFRKTIRKSLQSGGSLYKTVFKPQIRKKPRLILLCDISGSMALYSLFGLTLLFGVVQRFRSVKAFVFIDGLTEITKDLQNLKINNIKSILNNWNEYVKVDGHSDYQKSFEDLLASNSILNSSSNSLLVIGDARNNYRSINRDTIDKLSKCFKDIYWMNPERSQYWNTGDSRFMDFQQICEHYSEVRNFKQLKDFIIKINFRKVIR